MALWILTKAQPFEHFPATAKHCRICHSMICHEIFTLLEFLSISWKTSSNTPTFSYLDLLFTSFRSVPNHLPILSLCWSTSCLKLHNTGNWAEISCCVTWQRKRFLIPTQQAKKAGQAGQIQVNEAYNEPQTILIWTRERCDRLSAMSTISKTTRYARNNNSPLILFLTMYTVVRL